ncbi:hypothetical protein HA402_014638 [Bradysia odoriphaga]|nr:hypothetical protein HA402_014638 [Bradysia odoriphaga]
MCSAPTPIHSSNSLCGTLSPTQMAEGGRSRNGHHIADSSDNELESSPKTQTLEKAKTDRTPVTKPEEDRRRRTIIIEKKNGSYGFTIQSYGIHYKKEQEVEMITYVDFVEYDGPAFKSGMREGDVILSINGADMEKADHKTLVAFIKNCDTRMRMVVLFEDCVRKVELHMRYIQLQNILNAKMNELERTCLREREILEGKWKTHSLPARKKTTASSSSPTDASENIASPNDSEVPYCRPTLSTEDINSSRSSNQRTAPPTTQFMLTYQYLDPHCRYILRPSAVNSGEYLVIGQPSRSKSDHQQLIGSNSSSEHIHHQLPGYRHPPQYNQQQNATLPPAHQNKPHTEQKSSKSRHCHGHSCNPCVGQKKDKTNGDNVSLDAYDLASPCCDPHCVPTRRKNRHHKDHHHKHKHRDKETKERTQRPRSQSHASPTAHPVHNSTNHNEKHTHRPRFYDISAGLASHCSLHSCTSSDMGNAAEQSMTSYSTSLSTDTLFWDPHTDTPGNSRQQSTKSRQSYQPHQHSQMTPQQQQQFIHRYHIHAAQIQPTSYMGCPAQYITNKPKSWDNLAMKGYGGYGFGYGYLDTVGPKKQQQQQQPQPTAKLQHDELINQQRHSIPRKNPYGRYSTLDIENYAPPPSQFVQAITTTTITKSTENLISPAFNQSDSNLHSSCIGCKEIQHFHQHDCRGYYSHLPRTSTTNVTTANGTNVMNGRGVATVSEVTRL